MGGAPRSRKAGKKTTSDSAEEASLLCEDGERPPVAPRSKFSPISMIHSLYQRFIMTRFVPSDATESGKDGAPAKPLVDKVVFIRHIFSNKSLTPMQRVYLFFGLRQGTMLIAVHDMLWCSFLVFLLVLGTAHAREVSEMVEADAEDNAIREGLGGVFSEDMVHAVRSRMRGQDNDAKLHHALHMATVVTLTMFMGIAIAGVDMIASMMLLAGAMLRVRQLMMPWLSIRLLEMMLIVASLLFTLVYFARGWMALKVGGIGLIVLAIIFYHWLVAYSLHEHLCLHDLRAGAGGVTHRTTTMMMPQGAPAPTAYMAPQAQVLRKAQHVIPRVVPHADIIDVPPGELLHQYQPRHHHHHHHHHEAAPPRVFLGPEDEHMPSFAPKECPVVGPGPRLVPVPPEHAAKFVASAS